MTGCYWCNSKAHCSIECSKRPNSMVIAYSRGKHDENKSILERLKEAHSKMSCSCELRRTCEIAKLIEELEGQK